MKKDFTAANTEPVYSTIAAATATADEAAAPASPEQTDSAPKRGARKEYHGEEAAQYEKDLKGTRGRKGCKLNRINMAFTPEVYEYIQIMSKQAGMDMTEFTNLVFRDHMERNKEIYDAVKALRSILMKQG